MTIWFGLEKTSKGSLKVRAMQFDDGHNATANELRTARDERLGKEMELIRTTPEGDEVWACSVHGDEFYRVLTLIEAGDAAEIQRLQSGVKLRNNLVAALAATLLVEYLVLAYASWFRSWL